MAEVDLGPNIRRLLGARLMTQQDLAVVTGLSVNGINNIVQGHANPSVTTAGTIARAFGIGVDTLVLSPKECLAIAVEHWDDAPVAKKRRKR